MTSRARLHPAVAAVRAAVRTQLADLAPGGGESGGADVEKTPGLVLVACSGGADSLALAAATAFVAPRLGLAAGAVVVDHGWSPSSAAVASRAARTVAGLGLAPVDVVRVECTGPGGPEAAARSARYGALEAAAARHRALAVLLGHTLDDQAETVLLGLARGSGTRSLAGMAPRRGPYRRPLLGLPRSVTAAACAAQGLTSWHDPANDDHAYARSRVRAMLPQLAAALGPGLPAALARSADVAREDADALDDLAGQLLEGSLLAQTPDVIELDAAALTGAADAIRRRVLLLAARRVGCPAGASGGVARVHVLALDALLTRWRGQGPVALPGGASGRRTCGRLVLTAGCRRSSELEVDQE